MLSPTLHLPGSITETPVTLQSKNNPLNGILSTPGNAPACAVIFSHGWSGTHLGPGDNLARMARHLCQRGAATLRFDFSGRGESGGDGLSASLTTMAGDLTAAVTYMTGRFPGLPVVLVGMCSGGNVAIGTLNALPAVRTLILLSVYPFSDGDSFGRDANRVLHLFQSYLKKACSLSHWKRLFTGDASLSRVLGVLFRPLMKRGENRKHEIGTTAKASTKESRLSKNAPPPTSYLKALKRPGLNCLFIYGTADPDAEAAKAYYASYMKKENLTFNFQDIQGANHNYSSIAWQQQVNQHTANFLFSLGELAFIDL